MISDLISCRKEYAGAKSATLSTLIQNGFRVPDGFVIESDTCLEWMTVHGVLEPIREKLACLNKDSVESVAAEIDVLLARCPLPDAIPAEIERRIGDHRCVAVRSSGLLEDLDELSFAGQYCSFLNIKGSREAASAVAACYRSMFGPTNLSYLYDHHLLSDVPLMAVLVEDMIDATCSGVGFTVNPMSGNDKEMVFELAEGIGDALVGGRVNPETFRYNWYEDRFEGKSESSWTSRDMLRRIGLEMLRVQVFFGFPCDIEFAIRGEELFILQSRPVTKIKYSGIRDQWTTADFRDGGVASGVCKKMMWSLYEYVWENATKRFLIDSKLLKEKDMRKLGEMFFGRGYWNLSLVKEGMLKVPGFIEREFDEELGVTVRYSGNGRTSRITPKLLIDFIRIVSAHRKLSAIHAASVEAEKEDRLRKYEKIKSSFVSERAHDEIIGDWLALVRDEYLRTESFYFWQIYINTVRQPLFKSKMYKYVDNTGYLDLISGLGGVSHLRYLEDLKRIGASIAADPAGVSYWTERPVAAIRDDLDAGRSQVGLSALREHLTQFGYHSLRELDISCPCFDEDPVEVITMLRDIVDGIAHRIASSPAPIPATQSQADRFENKRRELSEKLSARVFRNLDQDINRIRRMLWWREELKDISTRYYFLIRKSTLRLASILVADGILQNIDDIWHIGITELFDFFDGQYDAATLRDMARKNRMYYMSFRHFRNENEVGGDAGTDARKPKADGALVGVGCNNGIVSGRARVIPDAGEIHRIEPGDILVTRFTDTGWTGKFSVIAGVVTEYGGTLCHAAIVAREYGIPCVVSCEEATTRIKDGTMITVNGATGEVQIDV
ncbi:MAG TPA: PEP/pyruvate-binding domain-containing protein [Sedimentisphaerales bacterium]